MAVPAHLTETRFRRARKQTRTHLFVMALLVAACMAVATWPRDVPLSPREAAAGLGSLLDSRATSGTQVD